MDRDTIEIIWMIAVAEEVARRTVGPIFKVVRSLISNKVVPVATSQSTKRFLPLIWQIMLFGFTVLLLVSIIKDKAPVTRYAVFLICAGFALVLLTVRNVGQEVGRLIWRLKFGDSSSPPFDHPW